MAFVPKPPVQTAEMTHIMATSFSGPIPPPALLERYNEIIPDGANRILMMAEKQSAHRESLESTVVRANVAAQTRGSIFAFIICMTTIISGTWLISTGRSASGLVSLLGGLAGIVATFVYSQQSQRKERVEKEAALRSRQNR